MQGVQRVLSVLEAVAFNQPVGVGQLSKVLGLPKSTVQRHLWALSDAGWIRPVGHEYTRWTLTSRALLIGQRGSQEGQLREIALDPMRQLRDSTEETITMQVPVSAQALVQIERVDSEQAVRTYVTLGQVTPMYATSGGLAFLAHLRPPEVDAALAGELESLTPQTQTDPAAVREELDRIRERGYAVNIGMNRTGVCAVGAAVRDRDDRPVAALGISIPENRFDLDRVAWWGEQVIATTKVIQTRL